MLNICVLQYCDCSLSRIFSGGLLSFDRDDCQPQLKYSMRHRFIRREKKSNYTHKKHIRGFKPLELGVGIGNSAFLHATGTNNLPSVKRDGNFYTLPLHRHPGKLARWS